MKASFYALLALLALSMSACTTINPVHPTATVYPASQSVLVQGAPVADVPAVQDTAPTSPTDESAVDQFSPPLAQVSDADVTCMAMAIYHEARGEPDRGQAAVGWVILNRVEHPRYPKSICGVVWDRNPRGCQFSWVCDGKSDKPRDMNSYTKAREIALRVITHEYPNPVGHSIYFDGFVHGSKRRVGQLQIGAHRFFASYDKRG